MIKVTTKNVNKIIRRNSKKVETKPTLDVENWYFPQE